MCKVILYYILVIVFFVAGSFTFSYVGIFTHEKAHIIEANKEGINLKMTYINPFNSGGRSIPASNDDCEKFNHLPIEKRIKILHAGVCYSALWLGLFLMIGILAFVEVAGCKKINRKWKILILMLIACLLAVLIAILGSSIYSNVLSKNPIADWNWFNFTNCAIY